MIDQYAHLYPNPKDVAPYPKGRHYGELRAHIISAFNTYMAEHPDATEEQALNHLLPSVRAEGLDDDQAREQIGMCIVLRFTVR